MQQPMLGLGTGPVADAQRKEFATMLVTFAEITKERITNLTIQTYENLLFPQLTIDQVRQAMYELMRSERFIPKPSDIIAHIQGDPDVIARRAWEKVVEAASEIGRYRSVVFDDPRIHYAIDAMGGWVKLCEKLVLPNEISRTSNEEEKYREFKSRYLAFGGDYPSMLIGVSDIPKSLAAIVPQVYGDMEAARKVWSCGQAKLLITKGQP